MAQNPRKALVCFDLGGVLVRIRRTWNESAEAAGVKTQLRGEEIYDLLDFPLFDAYQFGSIGNSEFLRELGSYLGVGAEEAKLAHLAILKEPYEGTEQLVSNLHADGIDTACLSNTNALHWDEMLGGRFPNIANLRFKCVSHELRLQKPDPAIFKIFDRETGYDADHVIYFDDHQLNVDAARAHGWTSFLVDHTSDTAAQMTRVLRELEVLKS